MARTRLAAFVFSLLTALALPGLAQAQQGAWRLLSFEGVVRVAHQGAAPTPGHANEALETGAVITTGGDGRAIVDNGAQHIALASNSRISIAPDSNDGMTRILQDVGSALFQVDHRSAPHFRVETPLLAAVVKGTTFTVSSNAQEDMVHVAQGLVEVHANNSNEVSDVASGATAHVMRDNAGALRVTTPGATAHLPAGAAPSAVNYTQASDGVVGNSTSTQNGAANAQMTTTAASALTQTGVGNGNGGGGDNQGNSNTGNGNNGNGNNGNGNGNNGNGNGNGNGN
ncbi:MAG: FecR family protein, partial [Vitreimonas sp.]